MKRVLLSILVVLIFGALSAQTLNGHWLGMITMEGLSEPFLYEIDIREENGTINGYSWSRTADSSVQVQFQLAGKREGKEVVLQELQQITPPPPEWCLKYQRLRLEERNDSLLLLGNWSGGVCNPGKVYLYRPTSFSGDTLEREIPFTKTGKWTGHLDQSDRAYGFFYEISLKEDGTGTSFIVSEDSGGSAHHALSWTFDPLREQLNIKEKAVLKRTDSNWKWCIKSAALRMTKTATGYQLSGDWLGHIEENNSAQGKCAPGKMVLNKPVLSKKVVREITSNSENYELELARKVNINQVIEVQRPQLKIGVWDNGVYDGDVMTLYLNGKKMMEQYKVRKRKVYIDVELEEKNNFLVLHADDLGEISPNTVAISIFDGKREQIIVMSSNLSESGAILIKQIALD
ncbi:MAG TPA: hypothetical protein VJ953_12235 [Saprospiraceae bacterium]|nr:hypothetical protein [Saprospiraceae bacterium]